jgi:hypothetical protein
MRGTAEYFNSLDASLRKQVPLLHFRRFVSRVSMLYLFSRDACISHAHLLQTELESLRAQIRDASTVELKDREDNERLKKQVWPHIKAHCCEILTRGAFCSLQPRERYPAGGACDTMKPNTRTPHKRTYRLASTTPNPRSNCSSCPAGESATLKRNAASGTMRSPDYRTRCARLRLFGAKTSPSCSPSGCRRRSCVMSLPGKRNVTHSGKTTLRK